MWLRGKWLRGSWRRKKSQPAEKGEKEKRRNKMWAMVRISPCSRGEEQQERSSDETAHLEAVKRSKSRVAANPSVGPRRSHNPVIHSNLYDDDAELHW